jgi:hypothetical protein
MSFRFLCALRWLGLLLVCGAVSSCATAYEKSLGGNPAREYTRVFFTDLRLAKSAVNEALRSFRKDDSTNEEGGFYVTQYQDNTALRNSIDSLAGGNAYLKARFRLRVTVAAGKFNGLDSVRVSVRKEQLVERDVLEGERSIETDGVEEQTLLYRIGRLIAIQKKIERTVEQNAGDDSFLREMESSP